MRILITGARGFLGTYLVKELESSGHEVIKSSRTNIPGYIALSLENLAFDSQTLKDLRPDILINLSWHTNGYDYLKSPLNHDSLQWNLRLFKIVAESQVRHVISFGTSAEYSQEHSPANEIRKSQEINSYTFTKHQAYLNFSSIFKEAGINHTWLRVFQAYGEGQSRQRLLPTLFDHVAQNRIFYLSHPEKEHDWIHARDIAGATSSLLHQTGSNVFDIGTGISTSNLELCNFFSEQYGLQFLNSTVEDSVSIPGLTVPKTSAIFQYFHPKIEFFEYLRKHTL